MTMMYLAHHGIRGMKWGVRRYQNKDGSLTAAGRKRYDRDIMENNSKKKDNRMIIDKPDPNRWAREDLTRVKKTVDSSARIVDDMKRMDDSLSKRQSKNNKIDLSNMTDDELRQAINRANMEAQYARLLEGDSAEQVSNGRAMAREVLDVAGDILTVGASAVGLALAIKELMG